MKAVTDTKYYDEIAKAIQGYTGDATMTPSEMAENIRGVWDDGHREGYEGGLLIGRADGIQAQYDEFWDDYQSNGARVSYELAFAGVRWNDTLYEPKYPIVTSNLLRGYMDSAITNTKVSIDVTSTSGAGLSSAFDGSKLVTIEELIVADHITYNTTFRDCKALVNITFTGTIGKALDIHWSTKLSAASLLSILTACNKENAGVTVTLPATAEGKIENSTELSTAAETARTNGYTIVYD